MISSTRAFERAYEVSHVDASSDDRVDFSFGPPGPGTLHTLLVGPARGAAWTGTFIVDRSGGTGVDGVFGTPDPTTACVVMSGTAFLVDVLDPPRSERLRLDGPVMDVVEVAAEGVLIMATAWTITVVGADAVRRTTGRLPVESLRLDEIVEHHLYGVADPDDEARQFVVDLRTGAVQGGLARAHLHHR